jgi:hypothetical protein
MRKQIIAIVLLCYSGKISAQITVRDIHESLVKLNDTLYISKYEVSNQDYADFMYALRKAHDTLGVNIATIDSTQ